MAARVVVDPIPPTIEWRRGAVRIIDQRALPGSVRFVNCRDVDTLIDAIQTWPCGARPHWARPARSESHSQPAPSGRSDKCAVPRHVLPVRARPR